MDSLEALERAIQNHIAEAFPGHVTDAWIVVTHSNTLDDDTHDLHNYRLVTNESQAWHVDSGLVAAAYRMTRDAWDYDAETED